MQYGEVLYRGRNLYVNKNHGVRCYRYRIDPVPYVSSKRWHFQHFYKTPKSMNEKRQWDDQFGRRKRCPSNLPDVWDDWPRADRYDRSWKTHKKRKQWM